MFAAAAYDTPIRDTYNTIMTVGAAMKAITIVIDGFL
jgi:hypothetical protein